MSHLQLCLEQSGQADHHPGRQQRALLSKPKSFPSQDRATAKLVSGRRTKRPRKQTNVLAFQLVRPTEPIASKSAKALPILSQILSVIFTDGGSRQTNPAFTRWA